MSGLFSRLVGIVGGFISRKKTTKIGRWADIPTNISQISRIRAPELLRPGASIKFVGNCHKMPNFGDPVYSQYQVMYNSKCYKPVYFSSNVQNELQALQQRVLKVMPVPTALMDQFVDFVKQNIDLFLPRKRLWSDSLNVYLKNSNAAPTVKAAIKRAGDSLLQQGITQSTTLPEKLLYKWTTRKSFVKVENLLNSGEYGIKEKAPRLIQGATPEFIALVGPFFSSFQRYMKKVWNAEHFIHFTSGSSSKKMGEFISENDCWNIFENDVSSWDASVSVKLCRLEVWLAKQFGAPTAVVDLMTANINTHGFTTHGWRYKVEGTRKSGDPYTSCMNSLLNGLLHCFVFERRTNCGIANVSKKLCMLVQGDDNLLRHYGDRINFRDDLLELGFSSDSVYREFLYQAEFCSSFPLSCAEGTSFVPKPGSVCAKFGYFIDPPKHVAPLSILRGVCLGFEALKFVPLFRKFLDGAGRKCKGYRPYYERCDTSYKFNLDFVTHCALTDYELMMRYGFDCGMYRECCSALERGDVDHPYVLCLFDRETNAKKSIYAC